MNTLQKINFSLIGAGVLSTVPFSAQSQIVINSTQNAAINGDNNQITQVINQTIIYRPQKPNFSHDRQMNRRHSEEDIGEGGGGREHHENHRGRRFKGERNDE
jgi:hypothetical protein